MVNKKATAIHNYFFSYSNRTKRLFRLTHYETPSSTTHYYTRLAYISHTRTHTYIHSKKKDSRQRFWKIRESVEKGNQSR